MPLIGPKCSYKKKSVLFKDCLTCAIEEDSPCGFPYGFLKAASVIMTKPRPEIHVTDLVSCLRRAYLSKVSNYYENPSRWIAAVLGIIIHSGLEKFSPPNSTAELPLRAITSSGIEVVGTVDFLHNGCIGDWKSKRWLDPSKLPTSGNSRQINIYAWRLQQNGYEATSGTLEYVALGGATRCRTCKCLVEKKEDHWECPECSKTWELDKAHQGTYRAKVELYPLEKIEAWVDKKAKVLHSALEEGKIPPKTDGTWLCDYCSLRGPCEALNQVR